MGAVDDESVVAVQARITERLKELARPRRRAGRASETLPIEEPVIDRAVGSGVGGVLSCRRRGQGR
jgi:hypothetical protein